MPNLSCIPSLIFIHFSNEFKSRMGLSGRPRSLDDIGEPNAQPLVSGDAVSKVNSVKNSADAGAGEDLDVSGDDESGSASRWRRDADGNLGFDQNGNRDDKRKFFKLLHAAC